MSAGVYRDHFMREHAALRSFIYCGSADVHLLEKLLYVCARANFLSEGVEDIKREDRMFNFIVLKSKKMFSGFEDEEAKTQRIPEREGKHKSQTIPFHWAGRAPSEPEIFLSPFYPSRTS